jgi:hypothetical protein
MAVVNKMELGREISTTIIQVNKQIEAVREQAHRAGVDAIRLRDTNGNWVIIPLLAAKAQCLHALAIINQKD